MSKCPPAPVLSANGADLPTTAVEVKEPGRIVRLGSPASLLKAMPSLLGFHPGHSVVILGAEPPRGTVRVVIRYPLPSPTAPASAAPDVRHAVALLSQRQYPVAAAVGYGPDADVRPFIGLLRDKAGTAGIRLTELLRAEGMRYWSYACADPACCPPEGTPYDDAPHPALDDPIIEGVPGVLPSREALADLIAPRRDREAAAMPAAIGRAEERAARLTLRARQSGDPVTRRFPVARPGIRGIRAAINAYRQGQPVTTGQAAWAIVALRDPWAGNDAVSRMDITQRRAHLALWTGLTRLAPAGYAAGPAALLAWTALQSGNGALAHVALDRALADDPAHPLAAMLRRLANLGVPPAMMTPPMSPRQVAAWYRNGGGSTTRAAAGAGMELRLRMG